VQSGHVQLTTTASRAAPHRRSQALDKTDRIAEDDVLGPPVVCSLAASAWWHNVPKLRTNRVHQSAVQTEERPPASSITKAARTSSISELILSRRCFSIVLWLVSFAPPAQMQRRMWHVRLSDDGSAPLSLPLPSPAS
jgi:hypothetical protein